MTTTSSSHHVILKGRVQVRVCGAWRNCDITPSPSLAVEIQQDIEYRQGVPARIVWVLVAP